MLLIGLLTILLILTCIFLIFLILVQLPKKEAGAGAAFGGAATDALFGAGSGNAMTKITKYAGWTFFILVILLAMLQSRASLSKRDVIRDKLSKTAKPAVTPSQTNKSPVSVIPGAVTNNKPVTTTPIIVPPGTTNAAPPKTPEPPQ